MDFDKNSSMLKTLGHPVRLKIIAGLLQGHECNVNQIVETLSLPQSTVSQHLSILRNAGIIAFHKDGVRTCYHVINDDVKKIIEILH